MRSQGRAASRTVDFRVAAPDDDPDLRRLLRDNPMAGEIAVSLEREPNAFLAAAVEGERHHVIVARDTERDCAVGMASRSVYTAFVNGVARPVGYLGQLRLDRDYRRRPRLLATGFALLGASRDQAELPFDLTSIVADNVPARRLLAAGLPGWPAYRELEAFTTLIVPVWRDRRPVAGGVDVRAAADADLDEVAACLARNGVRYQFAPCWAAADLRSPHRSRGLAAGDFLLAIRTGRLVGCLAIWNQQAFKQVVVRGYSRRMRWTAAGLRLVARVLGTPALPEPGRPLPHAYLSHVAVDDDAPDVFAALMAAACARARSRKLTCLIAGFAARHPFLPAIARRYGAWTYSSMLYTVHWPDARRDPEPALDGRLAHPEVAIL